MEEVLWEYDQIEGRHRLNQSQFVDQYFVYGKYGVIVVEGWNFNGPELYVRSLVTGEEFSVLPIMLVDRPQANPMQVIALSARGE